MLEKINKLKEDFCNAKNDKEREAVDVEMQKLIDQSPDLFAEAMVDSATETAQKAMALTIRQKMEGVLPAISIVYIAKKYFNKTDSWLSQRINGNIVNGKPAAFTADELSTLKFALDDISRKIGSLSVSL